MTREKRHRHHHHHHHHHHPKGHQQSGDPTYTPEQVAEAFTNIRDNLDLIELAYDEAISASQVKFEVWDATSPGYLEAQGLPRLKTPPESGFYDTDKRGAPDLDWIRENAVPKYTEDPLAIDIECYGKQEEGDTTKYTDEEIEWLRSIVEVFHDERPDQRVGIYMVPPERYGGCSPLGYPEGHPEYEKRWAAWTERNAMMQPLADECDILFPSLYGLYSNMDQWVRFAQQNVEQTRMLAGKKMVIGYLWPTWHNNAEATGPISYDDWTIMLETCFECCDGVAIWDYSSERFDPSEPWWKATEDFMKKHHLNGR